MSVKVDYRAEAEATIARLTVPAARTGRPTPATRRADAACASRARWMPDAVEQIADLLAWWDSTDPDTAPARTAPTTVAPAAAAPQADPPTGHAAAVLDHLYRTIGLAP